MHTSNLRCFIPAGTLVSERGDRFDLSPSAVDPVCGCCSNVRLAIAGQELAFSVVPVERGETLVLKRPGQRDHRQTFDRDGVVLDALIPAASPALSRLRGQTRLAVDLWPKSGVWRQCGGTRILEAHGAEVLGVKLAPDGQGNAELSIID